MRQVRDDFYTLRGQIERKSALQPRPFRLALLPLSRRLSDWIEVMAAQSRYGKSGAGLGP